MGICTYGLTPPWRICKVNVKKEKPPGGGE